MDEVTRQICRIIQEDIPLSPRPFLEIARRVGKTEEEVLRIVEDLKEKGIIRKFGAVLGHRKAGFRANGMVVWNVPEGERERVGNIMASFKEVTHCYERPTMDGWRYSIFTMVHGKTREECLAIAERISEATGIKDYRVLFSTREFKKRSMKYF